MAYVLDMFGLLLHDVLDLDMDTLYVKQRGVNMYVSGTIYHILASCSNLSGELGMPFPR